MSDFFLVKFPAVDDWALGRRELALMIHLTQNITGWPAGRVTKEKKENSKIYSEMPICVERRVAMANKNIWQAFVNRASSFSIFKLIVVNK